MIKRVLLTERKVSDEEAEKLAKELNIKLFYVSSKDGIMVEECFEYLAEQNYKKNGNVLSGADNIEDVRNEIKFKDNKNNNDDDIEELPSIPRKERNGNKSNRSQNNNKDDNKNNKGFQLGNNIDKKKEDNNKKNSGCC